MIIQSSRLVFPGCSGLTPMPRKMSGSAISMMEELTVAISMPSVVLDSAIHLYRDPTRPNMSPSRPKLTTSTAVTTR